MSIHKGDFSDEQRAAIEAEARRLRIPFAAAVRFLLDRALKTGWSAPRAHPTLDLQLAGRSVPGFVYVMHHLEDEGIPGLYKIGFSTNPQRRLEEVSRVEGAAVGLVCTIPTNDMRSLEEELHIRFAEFWERGEWFRLPVAIVDHLSELAREES